MRTHILSWLDPLLEWDEAYTDHLGKTQMTVTVFDRRCDRCGILLMVGQPQTDLDGEYRDCDDAVVRRVMES